MRVVDFGGKAWNLKLKEKKTGKEKQAHRKGIFHPLVTGRGPTNKRESARGGGRLRGAKKNHHACMLRRKQEECNEEGKGGAQNEKGCFFRTFENVPRAPLEK